MTLEIAILTALSNVHPRLLPEGAVRGDAGALLGTPVTITECARALTKLEGKKQVRGWSNEDTGTKWKITEEGMDRLAAAAQ